jgi:hypothetical protein
VIEVDVGKVKRRRAVNYTVIEDATLCRACAAVGMVRCSAQIKPGSGIGNTWKISFIKSCFVSTTQITLDI